MIKKISILFGVIFTVNNVFAQGGMGGATQEAFVPATDEETFVWEIPSKWYPFSNESEVKSDAYIFPTGQGPKGFKEMLHYEEFQTTMGVVEAVSVYELKTESTGANCPTYQEEIERQQKENGYSMIEWSENCVSEDDSVLYALTKVIVGNDKLYIAKKVWKYAPKEPEQMEWNDFFLGVYVCDPTTGDNECFPPNGRGGGGGGRR